MPITYADLAAALGREIEIETSAGSRTLRVVEATTDSDDGQRGSLLFTGPAGEQLAQDTYPIRLDEAADLLFLVPIGPRDGAMIYQAVFN